MPKRLIVNADDFGYTRGINRAILECAQDGILTSATIMARANAVDDACQLADRSKLALGCHIVLVDGGPVTGSASIPSLAPTGRFNPSLFAFAKDVLLRSIPPAEIEREAFAQFQRLQNTGTALSHFDTHKHTHALPPVLRPLLRAAYRCGVLRLRNPFEPEWTLSWRQKLSPACRRRAAEVALLRRLRSSFLRAVRDAGFQTTDGALGVIATGALNEPLLCSMLDRIPEGTWELVCHPGYNDSELRSQRTRLLASREIELRVLTSASVRAALQRNHIQLISFADL